MGQSASSEEYDEDAARGDKEEEVEEDGEEGEREREAGSRPSENVQGFHMVFSPELARRLRGESEDETETAEQEEDYEAMLRREQAEREQERQAQRQKLHAMAQEEVNTMRQLDQALSSSAFVEPVVEMNSKPCLQEEAACLACMKENGSVIECQEVMKR